MATFRSGFKIFGELTLRQSLGRIRSYSEDRKPGSWLPEDQWAVRPPCTTCPDPCTPKKPKATKSWLSICRDPEPPLPCDIRHNNCPPPKTDDEPWYAFITKKKPEKPKPPLSSCRAEMQRQAEMPDEEETCENIEEIKLPENFQRPCAEEIVCKEREPAPVVRLSCPPPKELDLMLWCGQPCLSVTRIASQCLTDRMPYDEFRPRKCWKPPPYSLPCKSEAPTQQPFCCNIGRAPLSEFKQVEIPKPVYTRYKSVELEDENFLLCMTDAKCPPDNCTPSLAIESHPTKKTEPPPEEPKREPCPEKQVLEAASRKPVKLRFAPKLTFRPKPTKLIERRHFRNPCAQHSAFNLMSIKPPEEDTPRECNYQSPCCAEPPKVIANNLSDEPPTYERNILSRKPPLWMFAVSKPGSKNTPLVPHLCQYPQEPDWCGETDGLKFYDGRNDEICPKPPPDPYEESSGQPCESSPSQTKSEEKVRVTICPDEKFVLMPDKYNIRNMRPPDNKARKEKSSFQQFIEEKSANVKTCSKLYPQPKESILYDFMRNCPPPPIDPSKPDPPPRKPPESECPQPTRFYYRRYSTFVPFRKPYSPKYQNRMDSGDSKEKCKPRKLVPKPKDCSPPVKGPSCNELTLPCCPKAKIPPDCSGRKQMPPCKKKLAPKPSYSECWKCPTPPQRITECNAWEKRDMENARTGSSKGRKFSSWAPNEVYVRDSQNAKAESMGELSNMNPTSQALGPSHSEYLDVNDRRQSVPKPKRASPMQRRVFSGKEVMLNFMNPIEDSASYYISESLVKKRKQQPWRKLKTIQTTDRSVGNQLHERKIITLLLQDHHTRNESRVKNLRVTHRDSVLGVYVHNIFPRDIIGSIGNWITGLFKAQGKSSQSISAIRNHQAEGKTYVETVDVDRIMKLTKPFRHGIVGKDQTISCYTMGPFDGDHLRNKVPLPLRQLWGKQYNKSLVLFPKLNRERARSSMWKFESLSPTLEEIPAKEKTEIKLLTAPKETQKLSRLPVRKSEENVLSVMENLTKRAVLGNRNLYKNQNIRTGQLTERNGFRCYTVSTQRGVAKLPEQIQTRTIIKKELPKKECAIRPATLTARFTESGLGFRAVNVFEKTAKKRSSYINLLRKLRAVSNTELGLKNVMTSPNFVKDTKKLNGNILAESSIGKHLRKEVKDILANLDIRTMSETILKKRVNKLNMLDGDVCIREGCNKVGQRWQLPKFQKISRDIAEPISSLQRSASLDNITRALNNNLMLDDTGFGIIHYVDNQKQDKIKMRRIKSVRTISHGRLPFTQLFLHKKQKLACERKIALSETSQTVTRTRNFAELSKKPMDGIMNKNSNHNCKDICIDKQKTDSEGCRSNGKSKGKKNDDDDDDENSCRKATQKKKPGPNCPND